MTWLIWVWFAYMAAIAPITLEIKIQRVQSLQWQISGRLWGIPFAIDQTGWRKLAQRSKNSRENRLFQIKWLWLTLRQSGDALRLFFHFLRLEYLGIDVGIAAGRADQTAIWWGVGEGLAGMVKAWLEQRRIPCRLRLYPDFNASVTTAAGGCILFVRLGNLLLASLMIGLNAWRARRMLLAPKTGEEGTWITQSGA